MITSEITIRSGMRPCGECRTYVAATGCVHWKPSQKEHDRRKRNTQCQRRRRARMKEQLELIRAAIRRQEMASRSNPGNGPRVTIEHARTKETQTLAERGKDHPAGPGVTVIRTYEGKR